MTACKKPKNYISPGYFLKKLVHDALRVDELGAPTRTRHQVRPVEAISTAPGNVME